jgi:hypothetical protein
MKVLSVLGLTLAAVGCRSYVEISEVTAERGDAEEMVVRFKAPRDVTRMGQFIGAELLIEREGGGPLQSAIADKLVCVEQKTDAPGSCYTIEARFPFEEDFTEPVESPRRRRRLVLTPGRYELEFYASGGMCGGPGGFYTNDVRIKYVVP